MLAARDLSDPKPFQRSGLAGGMRGHPPPAWGDRWCRYRPTAAAYICSLDFLTYIKKQKTKKVLGVRRECWLPARSDPPSRPTCSGHSIMAVCAVTSATKVHVGPQRVAQVLERRRCVEIAPSLRRRARSLMLMPRSGGLVAVALWTVATNTVKNTARKKAEVLSLARVARASG